MTITTIIHSAPTAKNATLKILKILQPSECNAVINCGGTQVVNNGGLNSVNFITLLCVGLYDSTRKSCAQ
jgi:hypothetical protein